MAYRGRAKEQETFQQLIGAESPAHFKVTTPADQRWMEQLIQKFNHDEYVFMAKRIGVKIAGFTERNFHLVPRPKLRMETVRKLREGIKLNKLKLFLSLYFIEFKRLIEGEPSLSSFYLLEDRKDVTCAHKMVILLLEFHTFLNEHIEPLLANLASEQPLLTGVVEPLSAPLTSSLRFQAAVKQIANEWRQHQYALHPISLAEDTSLDEAVDVQQLAKTGQVLSLLLQYPDRWSELPHEIRAMFNEHALINALQRLSVNYGELKQHQAQLAMLRQVADDNKMYKQQVKQLQQENRQQAEHIRQLQTEAEQQMRPAMEPLITSERVYLVTAAERKGLHLYMDAQQVVHVDRPAAIVPFVEQHQQDAQRLWFIDLAHVDSSTAFRIERTLEQLQVAYRFVQGTTEQLVQQVIIHLAGEMQYEVG